MRCPNCGNVHDKVLESRLNSTGSTTRRRRECLNCGYRFTSYERIEEKPITVIKRDGRIERFDIKKIQRGIRTCTDKLKISEEVLEKLFHDIEDSIETQAGIKREINSAAIGEETLKQLSRINTVAYVRFASVYRAFGTLKQFVDEIERLNESDKEIPEQED